MMCQSGEVLVGFTNDGNLVCQSLNGSSCRTTGETFGYPSVDLVTDNDQDGFPIAVEEFFGNSDADSNDFPPFNFTIVGNNLTLDNLYMDYDPTLGPDWIAGTGDEIPVFEISEDLVSWVPVSDGDITFVDDTFPSANSKIAVDMGFPRKPKLYMRANFVEVVCGQTNVMEFF